MAGELTIQIKKELSLMKPPETTEVERNKPRQMYLPGPTVHQDEEYYDDFWPTRVLLGPQFTGNDGFELKKDCLLHLLRRTEISDPLEYYLNGLSKVANELLGAYGQQRPDDTGEFLIKMLLDACFVSEFMLTIKACKNNNPKVEPTFNPIMWRIVKNHDEMKCYLHDILLLGNQLPTRLFVTLLQLGYPGVTHEDDAIQFIMDSIKKCISIQCLPRVKIMSKDAITSYDSLNILDEYRRCLLNYKFQGQPKPKPNPSENWELLNIYLPSATKMGQAGIQFTISGSTGLLDLHFQDKTLKLPQIVVDGYTKSLFLNLIAFEQLHQDVANNEVTSYMHFMGCLVQGADDASLLKSQGVIISSLPCAEVARVFNKISKSIPIDAEHNPLGREFVETMSQVRKRYNKMSKDWRMELCQTYLRTPWTILSIMAAVFIIALAVLQTLYSILSYYQSK